MGASASGIGRQPRYELLGGRVVMTPPAGHPHGLIEGRLAVPLGQFIQEHRLGVYLGSSQGFELPSGRHRRARPQLRIDRPLANDAGSSRRTVPRGSSRISSSRFSRRRRLPAIVGRSTQNTNAMASVNTLAGRRAGACGHRLRSERSVLRWRRDLRRRERGFAHRSWSGSRSRCAPSYPRRADAIAEPHLEGIGRRGGPDDDGGEHQGGEQEWQSGRHARMCGVPRLVVDRRQPPGGRGSSKTPVASAPPLKPVFAGIRSLREAIAMYVPRHFEESRTDVLHELVRAHPFATLVTQSADGLEANHLPRWSSIPSRRHTARLVGHVARANPVWRQAAVDVDALVIFAGPHGLRAGPGWYPTKTGDRQGRPDLELRRRARPWPPAKLRRGRRVAACARRAST